MTARIAALAMALTLFAFESRTVRGTVTDPDGAPVAGAVVKLKSRDKPAIRSFVTQQDGSYHFVGLHPLVDYTVQARTDKGSSRSVHLSHISSRTERVVNLQIRETSQDEPE